MTLTTTTRAMNHTQCIVRRVHSEDAGRHAASPWQGALRYCHRASHMNELLRIYIQSVHCAPSADFLCDGVLRLIDSSPSLTGHGSARCVLLLLCQPRYESQRGKAMKDTIGGTCLTMQAALRCTGMRVILVPPGKRWLLALALLWRELPCARPRQHRHSPTVLKAAKPLAPASLATASSLFLVSPIL